VQTLSCKPSLSTATGTGVEDFDLLPNGEATARKGLEGELLAENA
jgi:hypothetical protein